MRQLLKNKQKLYFSAPLQNFIVDDKGRFILVGDNKVVGRFSNKYQPVSEEIFARDSDGNILYTTIDGVQYPVLDELKIVYSTPIKFRANISFNSGQTAMAEYGLNVGDYNAVITADKGKLPFNEQTLIWHETTPVIVNGVVQPESADYRIIAVKTSLNEEKFILKKQVGA